MRFFRIGVALYTWIFIIIITPYLHRSLLSTFASLYGSWSTWSLSVTTMTNSVDDQTPVSRKDVFVKYLQYYDKVCCEGNLTVCSETQVTDEARRVLLLTEEEPRKRLDALHFYEALYKCAQYRDCHRRVHDFKKAAELLEMFCVNLFLFPWKKEIKTLKVNKSRYWKFCLSALPDDDRKLNRPLFAVLIWSPGLVSQTGLSYGFRRVWGAFHLVRPAVRSARPLTIYWKAT